MADNDVIDHETIQQQAEEKMRQEDEQTPSYQHYRKCVLGLTLIETLNKLEEEGKITSELKDETLMKFDKVCLLPRLLV